MIIVEALRQYRHNNSDEFVFGYDMAEVHKHVKSLTDTIEELKNSTKLIENSN